MQALSSTGTVYAWGSNAGAMRNDQPHVQRETEDGEPFQPIPQIVAGALTDQVVYNIGYCIIVFISFSLSVSLSLSLSLSPLKDKFDKYKEVWELDKTGVQIFLIQILNSII